MNGATLDTLALSRQLIKAGGFSQQQAEALAEALQQTASGMTARDDLAHFATKIDLAELKASLIKWMVGLIVGLAAFLGALIIGLFSLLPGLLNQPGI